MSLTSIRLPPHMTKELDEIAARRRATRSDLIREAVAQYCAATRRGDKPDPVELVERLVTYKGSGAGDLGRNGEAYLRDIFRARRQRHPR